MQAAAGSPPRLVTAIGLTTLNGRLWRSLASQRFTAIVFGLFAALGAMLAVLGIYGLVSYVVQLSAPEIGVRLALGASRAHVIGLVLYRGLGVGMSGVASGLAATPLVTGAVATP